MSELTAALLNGNRRALARVLTMVENESEGASEALATLFPYTGKAWIVGITGAPGTGKSSLVNVLAKAYRTQEKTVGIVAVDPTSPFTGGAILGDRIRMRDLSGDKGVFIRSMATRGSLGGLARATRDAIRVIDAAGFDIILVETVGAGQSEVDIVRTAQTTIVVEAPGLGDDVQAIKAGILEIADVLVINKSDRPGANNTERALKTMLELGHPSARTHITSHHGHMMELETHIAPDGTGFWIPPIIQTVATSETGIDELVDAIAAHRRYIETSDSGIQLDRQRIQVELFDRMQSTVMELLTATISDEALSGMIEKIQRRELDPQTAVRQLIDTHSVLMM